MKISLNLIKEFVKCTATPQEIAHKITLSLTEVENIEKKGADTILTIENKALTHRPDCFSHLGVAREIAAFFNLGLSDPLADLTKQPLKPEKKLAITVHVENQTLCPRYSAIVLTDLHVGPSPAWLSQMLESVGVRSINNVVDVTNYVMFELGQPLHAFDYDTVADHTIVVRTAKKGERLTMLDHEEYFLTSNHLVIADSTKPIGLAGIMGGAHTEVGKHTKTIILESAKFDAKNNRKTSYELGIRTEASTRFEKNTDPQLTYPALMRAVNLLCKIAGAEIASPIIDSNNAKTSRRTITVSSNWINKFLGINITAHEMATILTRLAFDVNVTTHELAVHVPSWRSDVTMPADLAEEVARIYGYDRIPVALPLEEDKTPKPNTNFNLRKKVTLFLKAAGFTEIKTSPFVGTELLTKSNLKALEHLTLVNPLTVDQEFMRTSLIPQLLDVASRNKPFFPTVSLFEIDHVFLPKGNHQPEEYNHATLLTTQGTVRNFKGVVEKLLDELGVAQYTFRQYEKGDKMVDRLFTPTHTAQIIINNNVVGFIGIVKPDVAMNFNLTNCLVADINIEALLPEVTDIIRYQPIPAFPPIVEDITFIFPPKTHIGPVIDEIYVVDKLIRNVELVAIYEKTRTFRIHFQDPNKSLTSEEVKKIRTDIIKKIESNFSAKVKA